MVGPLQANLVAREKLTRKTLAALAELDEVICHNFTLQDCQEAATQVAGWFGYGEVICLLQRFAIEALKDLPKSLYPDFIEFCDNCVKWKCPPSGSWSGARPTYPEHWEEQL